MFSIRNKKPKYEPLACPSQTLEEGLQESPECSALESSTSRTPHTLTISGWVILAAVIGFFVGALSIHFHNKITNHGAPNNVAPRITLQNIRREFIYPSPFSREPPQGEGSGEISEPIWDSLIPSRFSVINLRTFHSIRTTSLADMLYWNIEGLGYFKDESIASQTAIPTVFHQLHCLYILRRAYYSHSDNLQRFDFGKDRVSHVAHCFDYLQQGLTCSADSTIEPAIDKEHGFLGSGFVRQCRNFEQLKNFVAERRVFNATGFLAHGLEEGNAHQDNS